jgi:hypothetical protein
MYIYIIHEFSVATKQSVYELLLSVCFFSFFEGRLKPPTGYPLVSCHQTWLENHPFSSMNVPFPGPIYFGDFPASNVEDTKPL